MIDGVKVFEEEAWATCCSNSKMSYTELLQELMKYLSIDVKITLRDEYVDDEYEGED